MDPKERAENLDYQKNDWIYQFKKWYKKTGKVFRVVKCVAEYLECDDIVAVPGSDTKRNNLQRLFGEKIKRIKAVSSRKMSKVSVNRANVKRFFPNANEEEIQEKIAKFQEEKQNTEDYEGSFEILDKEIRGGKILLVDDITSTGWTLSYFQNRLRAKGFDPVSFALGIDKKKEPVKVDNLFIYQEIEENSPVEKVEKITFDEVAIRF